MTGNINPKASDAVLGGQKAKRRAKVPEYYAVHIMMEGGHRETVNFPNIQDFQKWYSGELVPKAASNDFISVPIKNIEGEYMVVRPSRILAIRMEPIFTSSVERYEDE